MVRTQGYAEKGETRFHSVMVFSTTSAQPLLCCKTMPWTVYFVGSTATIIANRQPHLLSNQGSKFCWIINGWAQNTICCGGFHEHQHARSLCVAHLHVIKFDSSQLSLHGGGLSAASYFFSLSMLLATTWFKTNMSHNDLSKYFMFSKPWLSSDAVF